MTARAELYAARGALGLTSLVGVALALLLPWLLSPRSMTEDFDRPGAPGLKLQSCCDHSFRRREGADCYRDLFGPYWKLSVYKPEMDRSVLSRRVVYIGEMRSVAGSDGYARVAPGQR